MTRRFWNAQFLKVGAVDGMEIEVDNERTVQIRSGLDLEMSSGGAEVRHEV